MARWLFDSLKKSIEGRRREHVHLVDDVDLPHATSRRIAYTANDFLAHIFNTRTTCGVQLVHVGMRTLGNSLAFLAGAIGFNGGALFAHQGFGKNASCSCFTGAARTAEQIGMRDLILLDCVFQRTLDMLLPHDISKRGRTIFAIQRLHAEPPSRIAKPPPHIRISGILQYALLIRGIWDVIVPYRF